MQPGKKSRKISISFSIFWGIKSAPWKNGCLWPLYPWKWNFKIFCSNPPPPPPVLIGLIKYTWGYCTLALPGFMYRAFHILPQIYTYWSRNLPKTDLRNYTTLYMRQNFWGKICPFSQLYLCTLRLKKWAPI